MHQHSPSDGEITVQAISRRVLLIDGDTTTRRNLSQNLRGAGFATLELGDAASAVEMLPSWLRWMAWGNPFFYFINGLRGAMIGIDETPAGLGIGLTLAFLVVLGTVTWRLFSKGYGLRE